MYRHLCYDQGQELALKYQWVVLQVASTVAHNTFINLYSHLDNTDGGEKSIYQYCTENAKLSVYSELREEGYPEEIFVVSPKNAQHFDLKATHKFTKNLIADKMCGSLTDVLKIMKEFVYLRNDLCHLALQSLTEKDFKMKLHGMWENFHKLYRSACELTETEFSPHVIEELDTIQASLMSSVKIKDGNKCKRDIKVLDNINEGSRAKGTSQSLAEASEYFESANPANNKWSGRENPAKGKLTRSQTKKSTKLNVKDKSIQTKAETKRKAKNASTQVEGLNEVNGTEGITDNNNNNSMTVPESTKNERTSVNIGIQVNLEGEVKMLAANLIYKSLCGPSTCAAATRRKDWSGDVYRDSGVKELPSWIHSNGSPYGCDDEGYLRGRQPHFHQHDTNSKKEKKEEEKSTRFASKIHSNESPKHSFGGEGYLKGQEPHLYQYDTNSKEEKSNTSFNSSESNRVHFFKDGVDRSEGSAFIRGSSDDERHLRGQPVHFHQHHINSEKEEEKSIASFNASTQHTHCTCSGNSVRCDDVGSEDGKLVIFLQYLIVTIVYMIIFCIQVVITCTYDLVVRVKTKFTLGQMVNTRRLIIDADTGNAQLARVMQAKGTCLELKFMHSVRGIPLQDYLNKTIEREKIKPS
ncbi:hypothetical protein Pcinc_040042 [Petrolisthes cinctipes]|uniref:Uncharacterized protein n=1 Tax=Petrolisthes cinctipes TaxID=88211 RepID=A0AAE1BMD0_PETCI|nr:hypothetical protein Pcinc_040042 [Petrolisthes cinctipes]